ncbi:facilitated trehalose transporter Tret1-like [Diaphorina citri]|uniref:Facilitated trehalose transporter Tret1-like n=1 Tax=Diaphorina citri TaxID=121845 RepID=A0A3Q0IXQ9_DIACI|nr:facilitated trehalose transporter Tret1-like [Diaphorina citri]
MKEDHVESIETGSVFRQYLVTIIVTLSTLNYGILVGWPSPVQRLLQSKTNPAIGDEPFTDDMMAMAGAVVYIGATIGSCFWAFVANKIGRQKTSILIVLPYVITWTLVCFTNSSTSLYIARMIGGLGLGNAGSIINAPMYVAEICTPRLRDHLGPFLMVFGCIGTLYAYTCGWLLPFHIFNYMNLVIAIFSVLVTCYLPETPVYYLKCNELRKAKRSLIWLRNYQEDNEEHLNALETDLKVLESSFLNRNSLTPWRDLLIPSTKNAVLVGLGLISSIQFSGIAVVTVNAVAIFTSAEVNVGTPVKLAPHLSSIIIAILQLLSALGSVYIVSKFNRKFLLIVTYTPISFFLFLLGVFYYLKFINFQHLHHGALAPLVYLSIYIVAYYIAAGPVTYIVLSEIFPAENRNLCMGIVMFYQHILMGSLVRLFPVMKRNIGMFGCMWTYSLVTFIGVILIFLYLPETKNKSFKHVVQKLSHLRKLKSTPS